MNKIGFGFLRLPMSDAEKKIIDYTALFEMTDSFLAGGGRYFDTAYTYVDGLSEVALRKSLVERYERDKFVVADKLPGFLVKNEGDCERFFAEQCERTGLDYFDVYLLHWLSPKHYAIAEKFREFEFLSRLKAEGKAGKIGFSYHGDSILLERILTAHPEVDIVQLQLNYLDWDDPGIDACRCYECALRHGKEIVVMEPVKGGTLVKLPDEAEALLRAHSPERTSVAWALAFVEGLSGVSTVLSGVSSTEQIKENLIPRAPLSDTERELLFRVRDIMHASIAVPCTGCRYCESHCPKNIAIPDYFALYNSHCRFPGELWKTKPLYGELAAVRGKASDCIGCKACERFCPQQLKITDFLPLVAKSFE